MKKKIYLILFSIFILTNSIYSIRLFYLSTDRTFSPEEQKRIKIESGYGIDSLKIRIYKINNLEKFYQTQDDFHRPKVKGRKLRYFTPEVVDDFVGYFRSNLREWARDEISPKSRESMINEYPDMSNKVQEYGIYPSKVVDVLTDSNFSLITENKYVLQNTNGEWNYNYVFMNNLEIGTYLIEGVSTDNVAYTILNVSDYGFLVKKGNDNVLIYTLRTDNSQPVSNVELTIYNRFKKELKKAKTGSDGMVKLNLKENDLFMISKTKNGAYTFFDPKYFPSNVRDNYVYIYTERPVYRGGDDVYLKGILRKYGDDEYSVLNTEKDVKLEIVDPQGSIIYNYKTKSTKEGIFDYKFDLNKDVKSGRYLVIASIDGRKYESEFKVEYYIKPEYEVKVNADKNVVIGGERIKSDISALYYYGDPVKGARCRYSIYKTRYQDEAWHKDQEKSFYITESEYVYSQMELIKTGELNLDDNGRALIDITSTKENYAYYYSIQVITYKDAGTPVIGSKRVLIVPSNFKISIDADKFVYLINENVDISFFTSDYENNPVSNNLNIKVSTELNPGNEYVYLTKQIRTDQKGIGNVSFKADKPGFVKIEVNGTDEGGNRTYSEKYIWIGQEGASYNYKGGRINLVLDKPYYKVGETAKLLVLSPVTDVKMLFTIEGDIVYDYSIEKLNSNSLLINIPIKKNYLPNVFADVSFIFDNELYNNTIKINVPPDDQFLNINITSDNDIYSPRSKGNFKVNVTDNNNNPVKNADISIAVVDEKIYYISKEIAIDIRNYFYPFRRNNVMMWSSIGFRFYGYSMQADTELARSINKADTSLAAFKESDVERKTFKDTALWITSLKTDSRGEADFQVDFPDNITKWRITAVGVTPDTKVGKTTYNVITKLTFFSDLVVPNVMSRKDKSTIYTVLHNYSKDALKTDLTLSGENVIIANDKTTVTVDANSEKTVEWEIQPDKTGEMKLKLSAVNEKYKDSVSKTVTVVHNSIQKIVSEKKEISEKDSSISFRIPENIDFKEEGQVLHINLSHSYASVIIDALPYLINYPYGCVEQTTSSFLPNLVASNAMKKFNIKLAYKEKNLNDIISSGLSKLYSFQQQNGSWGWFNENSIDVFMTSYVLYALTLTREFGYSVDDKVLKNGFSSLEGNIYRARNDLEKLYALYVLSMNNKKIYSIFDDISKNYKKLGDYELAILILTSLNYNKKDDATKAAGELKKRAQEAKNGTLYWGENKTENWYKDSVETTAWVVKAFSALSKDRNVVSKVLGFLNNNDITDMIKKASSWLIYEINGDHWKSTRDTAAVVFALSDYLESQDFNDNKTYRVKLNSTTIGQIVFNKNNFSSSLEINSNKYPYQFKGNNTIQVEGLTKNDKIFVSTYFSYFTSDDTIYASSNNISIKRKYYLIDENKSGDSIKYSKGREIGSIVKGNNYLVELDISCPKNYEYVFIEDYIPSGATFVKDFLIYNIDGINRNWKADYTDYRDNKVHFFLARTGSVKLYYVLTSVYKGKFKVTPASASLMYFPEVRGNSNDNTFIIE